MVRVVSIVLAALVAASCTGLPSLGGHLPAGNWQLENGTVDGEAIPRADAITLLVEGQQISGQSACNHYSGSYSIGLAGIEFPDGLAATAMACDPTELMDAEAAYLEALGRVETPSLDGGRLTLSGPGVELRFRRLP